MKTRFTLDLKVFHLMLKELRGVKKEIRALKAALASSAKAAQPVRQVSDKIHSYEVMKMLKITPATLIKYEKQGLIKFHKEGRNKVYSEAEIVAFKKFKRGKKRLSRKFLATKSK
ncbi:MAG TPA: MerR family transcriptional regulator [Bacteroidia bacterium]|jgi:hypothetical protein|nr:MerR family transcriptional regulator [Bacteroidia bacterium]